MGAGLFLIHQHRGDERKARSGKRGIRSVWPSVRRESDRLKDDARGEIFRLFERLRIHARVGAPPKIFTPDIAARGRFAVLDPARFPPGRRLIFRKVEEVQMTIEQHIEELRAELSWCDNAAERRRIETELRAAERRLKRCERARWEADRVRRP
jgi:hypothetical protein